MAFNSLAAGLTAEDTTTDNDIFVRDRVTGVTTLASVDLPGARVNGDAPAISSDGRWVVFEAYLSGPGLPRHTERVLLRDLATGRTVQVTKVETSAGEGGSVHPVVSRDGRFVAFGTVARLAGGSGSVEQVLRWTRATGGYQLVSATPQHAAGDGYSFDPSISDDGRYVSFTSYANDLTRHGAAGVYLRDMAAGRTAMVSVTPSGRPGNRGAGPNSIGSGPADTSADGWHVAFTSSATNLLRRPDGDPYGADVFVRDALPGG